MGAVQDLKVTLFDVDAVRAGHTVALRSHVVAVLGKDHP